MFIPALSPDTQMAINQLQAHAEGLAARFPEHRITFGYIGNIERWGDDRCWRIFTRYNSAELRTSISYQLGETNRLSFTPELRKRIDTWAEGLAARVAASTIV